MIREIVFKVMAYLTGLPENEQKLCWRQLLKALAGKNVRHRVKNNPYYSFVADIFHDIYTYLSYLNEDEHESAYREIVDAVTDGANAVITYDVIAVWERQYNLLREARYPQAAGMDNWDWSGLFNWHSKNLKCQLPYLKICSGDIPFVIAVPPVIVNVRNQIQILADSFNLRPKFEVYENTFLPAGSIEKAPYIISGIVERIQSPYLAQAEDKTQPLQVCELIAVAFQQPDLLRAGPLSEQIKV